MELVDGHGTRHCLCVLQMTPHPLHLCQSFHSPWLEARSPVAHISMVLCLLRYSTHRRLMTNKAMLIYCHGSLTGLCVRPWDTCLVGAALHKPTPDDWSADRLTWGTPPVLNCLSNHHADLVCPRMNPTLAWRTSSN